MADADAVDVPAVQRLGRTLCLVLLLLSFGYVCKAFKIMGPDATQGMSFFAAYVALPALLFRSIATLDEESIDPVIVGSVFISKTIVFALSVLLGLGLSKDSQAPGTGLKRAGLFALCTTMSDDVALGFPLLSALFNQTLGSLLFILSAMQASIFNTVGLVLIGVGTARATAMATSDQSASTPPSVCAIVVGVLLGMRKNPLIVSVVFGGLYRVTINLHRATADLGLPWIIDDLTSTAGSAFMPLVLFLAGSASVGTFASLGSLRGVWLPILLVTGQTFILPILCRVITVALKGTATAQAFSFVYGILPCANAALVLASIANVDESSMQMVTSYLALGKAVAFPYLILAASVLGSTGGTADLAIRTDMSYVANGVSVAGALWLALALCVPAYRRCPHRRAVTFGLLQGLYSLFNLLVPIAFFQGLAPARAVLHFLISFTRWAINAFIASIAIDDARTALARARGRRRSSGGDDAGGGGATGGGGIAFFRLCAASGAFGALMTVPWTAACPLPTSACLTVYLPYEGECGHKRTMEISRDLNTYLLPTATPATPVATARCYASLRCPFGIARFPCPLAMPACHTQLLPSHYQAVSPVAAAAAAD